jgi:DNA-binding response OmpR family regulator
MTSQSILVVDDEAPVRKLLSGNLKASGYQVRTAADGTEALKLIEEHPFDLLLLDVSLPGPNGLQVLEAVRRDAEIPVLMLSGGSRERDTHRQVLQAVWGGQYGDEADYLWTFVQRIRRKIEPNRREPMYLVTESGVGYRMPSADGE